MIGPSRRTFKNLVDEVLGWSGMSHDTNNLRTLAKAAVAAAHQKRLTSGRWSFMLFPAPQRLSIVAGQQSYALHEAFLTPQYFRSLTNPRTITTVPHSRVLQYLPANPDTPAAPLYVTLDGVSKFQNQPAAASVITPSSSNSGDNGRQVTVVGETATGLQSETLTLPNAGSVEFTALLDITKGDGTWLGNLSLSAGATTLLTLGPTQYGRQFPQLRSLVKPISAETWEYNFYRQPKRLTLDNDIPDLPFPFDQLLVIDARLAMQDVTRPTAATIRELERQAMELEQDMIATFQEGLAEGSEPEYVTLVNRD